jgi:ABC-2 type transport system permease protein
MATGEVKYIRQDFNPLSGMDVSGYFNYVLNYNLVGGDAWLADRMGSPYVLDKETTGTTPARDENNPLSFFLPYAVTMLFYIMILASSSFMLNSVTSEKQNRVMEILMSSVTPMQMLTGKIIALGAVGLLQTLVWAGAGFTFLRMSGSALNIPVAFQIPASFLLWSVVFFLLGYFLYASLLSGVGALVPNLREASQATTMAVIPLVIPIMFLTPISESSNGTIAMVLSLFPLTSPVTMMTRLSIAPVPLWQILLSIALLVATCFLAMRAVSGMFRAQTLLSGQSFSMKRFGLALLGRN